MHVIMYTHNAVKGGDLHEALMGHSSNGAAEGSINWYNMGAKIALDIARALEFLHSRKVSLSAAVCNHSTVCCCMQLCNCWLLHGQLPFMLLHVKVPLSVCCMNRSQYGAVR